jgi:hypothetical protein
MMDRVVEAWRDACLDHALSWSSSGHAVLADGSLAPR